MDGRENKGLVAMTNKRSALLTVVDLQTILRTDPDAFDAECEKIIDATDDDVTKEFWENVREFARAADLK